MKKVFATGLVAICLIAAAQQEASAWVNSKFGVGLNWERQSGGNNFGWGAWKNGQPPGPETFNGYPPPYMAAQGGGQFPQFAPAPYNPPMPQSYPSAPSSHHGALNLPTAEPSYFASPNQSYPPFQFATYPRPVYYYYDR